MVIKNSNNVVNNKTIIKGYNNSHGYVTAAFFEIKMHEECSFSEAPCWTPLYSLLTFEFMSAGPPTIIVYFQV